MYIWYNGVDIADRPGQRELAQALFDRDNFPGQNRANLERPDLLIVVDETSVDPVTGNQVACMDIFNHLFVYDYLGHGKYFTDASGNLFQRNGWRPHNQGAYTEGTPIPITFSKSAERTNFDTGFATRANRCTAIINTAPPDLPSLYAYVQDLARYVQGNDAFISRLTRPDTDPNTLITVANQQG